MTKKSTGQTPRSLIAANEDLRARLAEAEETLRAIRSGEVDALVISGAGGDQIFTLQGADQSYRVLIEAMSEGALTLASDRTILYANSRLAEMLKSPLEQVIGSQLDTWIAPDDQERLQALLCPEGPAKHQAELALLAGDGSRTTVNLSLSPLSMDGLPTAWCLVATDLTEHRRAEAAIRESDAKFRNVFEFSPLGKSLTGVDGTLRVNRAFCDLLGYSEAELQTRTWEEITHPDDRPASEAIIQSLLDGKTASAHFEKRYLHKDGHTVWAEVTTALQRDPGGNPLYFLTTASDITERRQAAERLARQAEELRRSNAELEQFAYVASHDLQEPLRMVSSYAQLLARRYQGRLDADADEFIAYMVDGATHMQQLIESLLAYSRVGTRGQPFAPVACEAVVDRVLRDLSSSIEQTGAVITHDPLPTVLADKTQLQQLFQNLVSNAVRFHGPEPPRIHLSAERQAGDWLFAVRDNGLG